MAFDLSGFTVTDSSSTTTTTTVTTVTTTSRDQDLRDVVRGFVRRAGLDPLLELDTSEIDGLLFPGAVWVRPTAAHACEEALEPYFGFPTEVDHIIRVKRRGGAAVADIPEADLGAYHDGESAPMKLLPVRADARHLPYELTLSASEPVARYETIHERAFRALPTGATPQPVDQQVVVAHTRDQLRALAEVKLWEIWSRSRAHRCRVSQKWLWLAPGDVFTTTVDGRSYRLEIAKKTLSPGFISELDVVDSDWAVYDQPNLLAPITPPADTTDIPTVARIFDLPFLLPTHSDAGYYVAADLETGTFGGATIWESTDGGASWSSTTAVPIAGTFGDIDGMLADVADPFIYQEEASIVVNLLAGSLTPATYDDLVTSSSNFAAVGREVIQFADATEGAPGVWTLTGLLRGRLGTEVWCGTHGADEGFVLLDMATTTRQPLVTSDIGVARQVRVVAAGGSLADETSLYLTPTGAALKPWAPVNIAGSRDGGNNLTLTWNRRSRYGTTELQDGDEPVLGETTEAYEVDVYSDGTYTTVVRTLTASTPTVAYSAANQVTDGLTPGATVYVHAHQMSSEVGRGYAGEAGV